MLSFKAFLAEKITISHKDISFEYHDDLHPDFWEDGKLRSGIRKMLLKIADSFIASFKKTKPKVTDIVFTGSLADYNWSSTSDVDVHVMFDVKAGGEVDAEDYIRAKLKDWRKDHKTITMKGFPVEVSVETPNESHDNRAAGAYSLTNDEWITKPKEKEESELDHDAIKKRVKELEKEIDSMMGKDASPKKIEAFKDRIRDARSTGLKTKGEFSIENLAFKALRKEGKLDTLWDHAKAIENAILTLK
jgi:predicted nucleotidyltransferase